MSIPDPATLQFAPAPAGHLRVVAFRQRTASSADPERFVLHAERAELLHRWASEHELKVDDWGATDADRPAEFVEFLLDVGDEALREAVKAALVALVRHYVVRYYDKAKAKRAAAKAAAKAGLEGAPPEPVTPLFALAVINESGGVFRTLRPLTDAEANAAIAQAEDPAWTGSEVLI